MQIIPSADGIQGKLSEALGGEASSAGVSAGNSLGKSLVGTIGKVIAAAGIGKMLQSAFSGGSSFETAVAKVETIADTSVLSIGELRSQITKMSGTMGIAAGDIAEAAYQAISAGQDTGNAVAFAGQASKLAAAGFTSSASAVDILTTALNAYRMDADAAAHVSDVLLTTQNLGKTSVDELSSSMGRVIPLAAAYSVNMENLSSSLAIMTANGIATAEATTYSKSMLNELGSAGSTVGKILKQETGQSFAQLMESGQSLGDVLEILYDSVGNDSTQFAGLWSSVEAGTGALSLANAGAEKFNSVLAQMEDGANITESAYKSMTDTMAHRMQSLKTNAQNLGIALFNAVGGQLGDAVGLVGGYLQTLGDGLTNGGFAGLVAGLGGIAADLTGNVGPQLLQSGIDLMHQLGSGLTTAIPEMLATVLPQLMQISGGIREGAGQFVDAGIELILNLARGLINGLPTMIKTVPTIVSNIAGIINDNAPKLLLAGGQLILMLAQGLISAVPTLLANLPQILFAIADVVTAFNWIALGGKIITLLKNGMLAVKTTVTNGMRGVMTDSINYIKSLPEQFKTWGRHMIEGLAQGIKDSIDSVKHAVGNVVSAITSRLHFSRPDEGPLRYYESWMPDFMHGLATGIRSNIWQVKDAIDYLAGVAAAPVQTQMQAVLGSNQRQAFGGLVPAPAGPTYEFHNEFHTHDSLSESEMTREMEDMIERQKWDIP